MDGSAGRAVAPACPVCTVASRRNAQMAPFVVVVLLILLLSHAWIGLRLAQPLGPPASRVAWALVVGNALLLPATLVLTRRGLVDALAAPLAHAGYVAMGLFSLICAALLAVELLRLLLWSAHLVAGMSGWELPGARWLPAEAVHRARWLSAAVLGAALAVGALGWLGGKRAPRIERHQHEVVGLPADLDGFRIVQISDLHLDNTGKGAFVDQVVNSVNQLRPDLVAFTGDLADGTVGQLRADAAPLARLESRHGSFFVTGNHEYYSGVTSWLGELERLGLTTLVNQHHLLEHGQARLRVAGVGDHRAGAFLPSHAPDAQQALRDAPPHDLCLLLAHQPRSAPEAARAGADLVLAGHTHGGQYFPWNLVIYLVEPYVTGWYRVGEAAMYVNRGTGTWGPPFRLGARSEITLIELVAG